MDKELKELAALALRNAFWRDFMQRINVEFGRLKGWVKDWKEAATEMEIPVEAVQQDYGYLRPFTMNDVPRLGLGI